MDDNCNFKNKDSNIEINKDGPEKSVVINEIEAEIEVQSNGIVLSLEKKKKLIPWSYLVGVTSENSIDSCFIIHFMRIIDYNGKLDDEDIDEKEFSIFKTPKLSYKTVTVNCISKKLCKHWVRYLETKMKLLGRSERKILTFVNPFSGRKKALDCWKKIKPLFDIARIDTNNTIVTEKAGHCSEVIQEFDLNNIDAIVTIGGDGILNELLNGIMKRKDWKDVLNIPLSVIPCGTGNALATSLTTPSYLTAAMNIIQGLPRKMDMLGFYQPIDENDEKTKWKIVSYGFEALMWGLVSDIDFESETMRYLGEARLTIGALKRIAALRHYPAKLIYLESDISIKKFKNSDKTETDDKPKDKIKKKKNRSNFSFEGLPSDLESSIKVFPSEENLRNENWKSLELNIVYFVAANITHISRDIKSNPYAQLDDGYIDVVFSDDQVTKGKILKFFTGQLENGKYVKNDSINYIKTKSFLLIPTGKRSWLNIDGERCECKPILVENFRKLINIYHPNWNQSISVN